ncbi:MAG: hypothetical protein HYR71_07240, partial [Chloroflexi bacterium]|nr:hypothetical protein [Chloroflexota bacterium]
RGRVQYLRGVAERLTPADVPDDWRASSIVHLGPVAQEFDADLCDLFIQNAQSGRRPPFIGLTPQGWLRQWDIAGAVSPCQWERAVEVLGKVDAVVFGWEDLAGDERLIRLYAQAAPLAVMTLGRRGAVVFARDQGRYFAARKVDLRDSTGAGDIFATAFFVSYYESGDPYAAARFASVAASFSVEGLGIQAVPTRQAISGWLAANPDF